MGVKKVLVIPFKGQSYVFHKTYALETDEMFLQRCWWVVKNITDTVSITDLLNLSHMWAAVKFLGVAYDDDIMTKISQCTDTFTTK